MIKICLYIGDNYFGAIMSKVVPRQGENILYQGKCYCVKSVIYDTNTINEEDIIPSVSLIGLEIEISGKEELK